MRVTANGKVWRSAAEWRAICERFAQSGLGVTEFCSREKLAVSSFQKWYERSRRGEAKPGRFIALPLGPTGSGGWEVEVDLPNGARLRLRG
jgi:hypothetical protein